MNQTNHVTVFQLDTMTHEEASKLPLDVIEMLAQDLTDMEKALKSRKTFLTRIISDRFADIGQDALKAKGKLVGQVTVQVSDEYAVEYDVPKKVEWDQKKLLNAVETIKSWGENPNEYVETKIVVSETKYNSWPSVIKKLFEPARTLSHTTPTIKLVRREKKGS